MSSTVLHKWYSTENISNISSRWNKLFFCTSQLYLSILVPVLTSRVGNRFARQFTKLGNCRVISVSLITMQSWKRKYCRCFIFSRTIIWKKPYSKSQLDNCKYLQQHCAKKKKNSCIFHMKIYLIILLFSVNLYKKMRFKFQIKTDWSKGWIMLKLIYYVGVWWGLMSRLWTESR